MNSEILLPLLVALAAFFLGYAISTIRPGGPAERVVWEVAEIPGLLRFSLSLSLPIAGRIRRAAAREAADASSSKNLSAILSRVQRALVEGGEPGGIQAPEFLGVCILAPLVGLSVGIVSAFAVGAYPALWILFFGGLLGSVPPGWLRERIRVRKTQIRKSLPFALDLLTLCVEAGMDFAQALGRLGERLRGGALASEFGRLLREIQVGKSRAEALRSASDRMGVEEFGSVAVAMIQADELGGSLGPVLRIQAEQVRERRFQKAEERAMKAPVKLIFALIPIFLCTIIIVFGSLLIRVQGIL
ncbi:MAG: type II secretion system F family protein [Planctomycetota bacterium]